MSFPFPFTLICTRAPLWRRGAAAWMAACLVLFAGLLGSGAAQATVYTFNGNPVDTCSLANKVYTCPYPAYLDWDDSVVIGSGYTLKVTNNVAVSYNQGLTMGSGAKLVVTGNLNLKDVNPANLRISGGDIEVGGTFSMGASAQSATANISAGAIQLGTDRVTITGNLTSKGVVDISSYSRITGDITGTVVNTGSPVTITGNVTASSKFTLASGSSVTGNITTAVFDMLAASSKVTGSVSATTSMTMGSANTVTGNVDTGDLLLQSSNAIITGNASVNWATLEWQGRVTGAIYCKNGTRKNSCDCVTNNSGYAVNSTNGPKCESAKKTPYRFLVTHDGSGDTCLPEKVTVTACANAACTAFYTDGVSGQLAPFGTAFTIPAGSSAVQVSATRIPAGTVTLDVTNTSLAPDAGEICYNSAARTSSCDMNFSGGAKLLLDVPNHVAASTGILARIRAVKANDDATACVTAFGSATYNVSYACTYAKPSSGSVKPALGNAALTCNAPSTNQTRSTAFDANGAATLALSYADVGEVALSASVDTGKGLGAAGSTTFVTAPARFSVSAPSAPLRAGASHNLTIKALNAAGDVAPNFDNPALTAAGATSHAVMALLDCRAQAGATGTFSADTPRFVDGVASVPISWSEVGRIDVKATLDSFLGTGMAAAGSTNTAAAGCTGNVGPFIPMYFKVELAETGIQAGRAFYYSMEPFTLKVSAMNKAGVVTRNYNTDLGLSEAVTLGANTVAGAPFSPLPGALSSGTIAASAFKDGVASARPVYTFSVLPTAPTRIRLRATNGAAAAASLVTSNYGGATEAAETGAMPIIRSGRLRLANAFGGAGEKLALAVSAEYWTGKSWLLNTDDNYTTIPASAFTILSTKQRGAYAGAVPFEVKKTIASTAELVLTAGVKPFVVQNPAGVAGWGDVAINLGGGNRDNSCVSGTPDSVGANRPWLRAYSACKSPAVNDRDPSGRATFGIFAPESKRIIHLREVFN